jgi:hypothetical protein
VTTAAKRLQCHPRFASDAENASTFELERNRGLFSFFSFLLRIRSVFLERRDFFVFENVIASRRDLFHTRSVMSARNSLLARDD